MFQTQVTEMLGIKYPIVGGTMMWISNPDFTAAMSNAGGLGILASAMYQTKEEFGAAIDRLSDLTDKPFGVNLNLFPTSGYGSLQHVVLPAIVLSARPISRVAQMTRSSMLDELGKHYTVTAYAKGLKTKQVVVGHVLKNAGIGIISMVGIEAAEVFAGRTVICEVIFSWPGIGWLAYRALFSMDFPLIQTVVLWAALVTVVVNLITDIAYAWFDPRIRYA